METITPYALLQSKFDEKFLAFDPQEYENVSRHRQRNTQGQYKASDLLLEIVQLSAFFVSEKVRKDVCQEVVAIFAFVGWKLSYDNLLHADNAKSIDTKLKKYAKSALKLIREHGFPNIKLHQIVWIIFCCAMIREKFYTEFPYDFQRFSLEEDGDDDRIEVAYIVRQPH